jgi:hypothetical protein
MSRGNVSSWPGKRCGSSPQPDGFRYADPQDATYVGYTVLPLSDVERSTLLAQARAFVITD